MKRALIASVAAGTLLLAGAGAANADSGIRFDVHFGVPLYGVRHAPPPRIVVIPRERHVRYWSPERRYYYRHHDRWQRWNSWGHWHQRQHWRGEWHDR